MPKATDPSARRRDKPVTMRLVWEADPRIGDHGGYCNEEFLLERQADGSFVLYSQQNGMSNKPLCHGSLKVCKGWAQSSLSDALPVKASPKVSLADWYDVPAADPRPTPLHFTDEPVADKAPAPYRETFVLANRYGWVITFDVTTRGPDHDLVVVKRIYRSAKSSEVTMTRVDARTYWWSLIHNHKDAPFARINGGPGF